MPVFFCEIWKPLLYTTESELEPYINDYELDLTELYKWEATNA